MHPTRLPPAPTPVDAVSEWRETHFRVHENGIVETKCDSSVPRIGRSCVCPLSKRLHKVEGSAIEESHACPLSRALHAFLHLVEKESFDRWSIIFDIDPEQDIEKAGQRTEGGLGVRDLLLRFQHGPGHYPLDRLRSQAGWPACQDCGLQQWMLQGPKTDCDRARWELAELKRYGVGHERWVRYLLNP